MDFVGNEGQKYMTTKEISLTQGLVSVVDEADYEWLSQWKWYANRGYAIRSVHLPNGKEAKVMMHRAILGTNANMDVDHIDGNGLNNTRANLREATSSQNSANRRRQANGTSGYKGVTLHKKTGKWQAQLQPRDKIHYLGLFSNPQDAARAYDAAARKLYGEFARTNFPSNEDCSGAVTP